MRRWFALGVLGLAGLAAAYAIAAPDETTATQTFTFTNTAVVTYTVPTVTVTVTEPAPPPPPPPPSSCADQPFCADYETGDFSRFWLHQWLGGSPGCGGPCTLDIVGNTSAAIVTSPVRQGTYAARYDAHSSGGGASTVNRAEALISQGNTGGYQGQEWWYGWWTMFPSGQSFWPNGDDWNDFTQFEFFNSNTGASGAYIYFGIAANDGTPKIYLDGPNGHTIIVSPLQFGHWYHFVVHAVWSTASSVGIFGVNIDGAQVFPDTHEATLSSSAPGTIYSQGFYSARATDNTVFHDGLCRAASYAAAASC